jgi:adenine-specific DNA methylase
MKRAIEDSFPIVEINRLAVPERNAFKPIYQMHKWFARRASCVFRAILLGALKPLPVDKDGKPAKSGAQVIMDEFYKDHTHDPDTNGKVILDPFMGGGTTIVEALRLGCKVIGIDLNPVAWFIVKTEIEPVDLDELRAAFDRLSERKVEWSGKSLRETLLDLYKTKCPSCGGEADIIYTFWVKSAICTDHNCRKQVPLFGDYIVAQKTPSIRYLPDCDCPECGKAFDWEIEPAAMVADPKLMVNAGKYSAGQGRTTARWAYGRTSGRDGVSPSAAGNMPALPVNCPWCGKTITPKPHSTKPKRKKVELSVLLCPKCEEVWQFRGPLSEDGQCPSCKHKYNPKVGNLPDKGKFRCSCGNDAKIIDSIRNLSDDQLLPMRPYGVEAYCPVCDAKPGQEEDEEDSNGDLFEGRAGFTPAIPLRRKATQDTVGDVKPPLPKNPNSFLWKNNGKFFARVTSADLALFQKTCALWEKHQASLPYPKSKVPIGEKTKSGLIAHHYLSWHQMFNPRQLLALATLLATISAEKDGPARDLLLCALSASLARNNMFCYYWNGRNTIMSNFDRHDFAPKLTPAENSLFQSDNIRGSFPNMFERVFEGKQYCENPYDNDRETPESRTRPSAERVYTGKSEPECGDSREVVRRQHEVWDVVITDPPYAGNVNYSELSDFFYVWLRLALKDKYNQFGPEYVPKALEIIENPTRKKSRDDFRQGLLEVFSEASKKLKDDGVMVFTFHHAENEAWETVLEAISEAGFALAAAYPVHGEKETSLNLMDTTGISFDLVHVCGLRKNESASRSWAGVRRMIRERARAELQTIQTGRYGGQALPPVDRNIILIGKCLELYSEHYGRIVDHQDQPVPLHAALEEIRMMVDQLTTEESALPPELEDIDTPSYVYLTCLCDRKEIKSDEVSKATRGITEPSTLMERDLMIKGRAKRGRTYEIKSPVERLDILKKKFGVHQADAQGTLFDEDLTTVVVPGVIFIDYVHFLIGLAETGESVLEWLDKFRGKRPQIRAALEYLAKRNRTFLEPVRKIMGLLDERTLFTKNEGD